MGESVGFALWLSNWLSPSAAELWRVGGRREVKLYEEFHDKYDELEKSARTRQQQTA